MTKPAGKLSPLGPCNGALTSPQIQLTCPDGSNKSSRISAMASTPPQPPASSKEPASREELTVCDITGDWGLYQWSLSLFATCYSALAAIVVMFGPILTPDMPHICQTGSLATSGGGGNSSVFGFDTVALNIPTDRQECFVGATGSQSSTNGDILIVDDAQQLMAVKCTSFLYNQLGHGLMLTNGVSRQTGLL